MQRREVKLDDAVALLLSARQRLCIGTGVTRIAAEKGRLGHTDAQALWQVGHAGRKCAVGVIGIGPFDDGQHMRGVIHPVRKYRYAIERATGRQHACRAHAPGAGLEADEAIKARRYAARACRVGAQRKGHQATRHRDGRAGTGTAAHTQGIGHAGRPAVGRAGADQAGGKLVEVGLADPQRTGIEQTLHHAGTAPGLIRKGRAGGGGGFSGDIDVVLDRKGHAQQRVAAQQGVAIRVFGQACGQQRELRLPGCITTQVEPDGASTAGGCGAGLRQPDSGVAACGHMAQPRSDRKRWFC